MQMNLEWSPDRTAALTHLWDEGIPTREIGRRLGVTKNAVVGKAHRIGLAMRRPPAVRKVRDAEVIRLDGLASGMCSWPEGEPGTDEFRFCGQKPTLPDKPYCAEHCQRAYPSGLRGKGSSEAA